MLKEFIREMVEASGISGYEENIAEIVKKHLTPYSDECRIDGLGSMTALKHGYGDGSKRLMLAAHMDEIGLMVKNIDKNGFISFTSIGGVDQRTLLVQEVIVHGSRDLFGVIGNKPPHILSPEEREKSVKKDDMLIDVGLPYKEVIKIVNVGDPITIKRNMMELLNGNITGKAMDDRLCMGVIYECMKNLMVMKHEVDVYACGSTQEEVGGHGAKTTTFKIKPAIGIAIDVTFGHTPELDKADIATLAGGPSLCFGASIHPKVFEKIMEVAKENNISIQEDITPAHNGTDGWGMQIVGAGVAMAVLSIPLRYMHTSVEVGNLKDVRDAGRLLSNFIVSLNDIDLEEWLCY